MTAPSGGTTTATRARRLREALIRINALRELESMARTISKLALAEDDEMLEAIIDGFTEPAPAPYTEPREGDEVEVTVRLVIDKEGLAHYVDVPPTLFRRMRQEVFDKAVAEGRVRLVKAAAPTYEPGALYVSKSDPVRLFRYSPTSGSYYADAPFIRLFDDVDRVPNEFVPSDLVPCDVVPREAS